MRGSYRAREGSKDLAKELTTGLFLPFTRECLKSNERVKPQKRAWSGNLNATHLLPCREDNKTQGIYCGENEYSLRPHKPDFVGATPTSATKWETLYATQALNEPGVMPLLMLGGCAFDRRVV